MHGGAVVMAHPPLFRTQTMPVNFLAGRPGLPNTMSASFSTGGASKHPPRGSHLSGSTAFSGSTTSLSSTLSTVSTVVPQPLHIQASHSSGHLVATSNIINQKADASRSLYQICVTLCQRLSLVPGFAPFLEHLDPSDPVDTLWALLRTGTPLLTIFNSVRPTEPLQDNDAASAIISTEHKRTQRAVFKFINGCVKLLAIPSQECFLIKDLTDNDTTGFVKVTHVVNRVLDIAEQRGFLLPPPKRDDESFSGAENCHNGGLNRFAPGNLSGIFTGQESHGTTPPPKMTHREYVVREMVDTERKYVQDLENLHDLKHTLEEKGVVPGDVIYQIFLNINTILDFQRRFLIKIESTNFMPAAQQQWGALFIMYEDAFDIYRPFIANQRKASITATAFFDKIAPINHPVAIDNLTLESFLSKPMQRLTKYPLLLKSLLKTAKDKETQLDLTAGCDAAERVLQNANEAIHQDLLMEAFEDLIGRVDDWKALRWDQFGKLLLHGIHGVTTGKSESDKDYEVYLFESILLCCKDNGPGKSKEKNREKTKSTGSKVRASRLHLKGRIFMVNVTDIVSVSKPGSHNVQIWWKGDPGIESFTVRFVQEDVMKRWASALDTQRKDNAPRASAATNPDGFVWMQSQGLNMENPYMEKEEEDDVDSVLHPLGSSTFSHGSIPRHGSNTSLRQRSMTSESSQSLAGLARRPAQRFPLPAPLAPLSLQTQLLAGSSAGGRPLVESHFSPIDTPSSTRTSNTSGLIPTPNSSYSFPRIVSSGLGWEDNNRHTAPVLPRTPSRDGASPAPYGSSGSNTSLVSHNSHVSHGSSGSNGSNGSRNPRGPSLPVMLPPVPPSAAQLQRSRSYSTADINGPPAPRRSTGTQLMPAAVPVMPGIPAHMYENAQLQATSARPDLPIRANTQSPGAQRDRLQRHQTQHQHSGSFGGSVAQYSSHQSYSRLSEQSAGHKRAASPATVSMGYGLPPATSAISRMHSTIADSMTGDGGEVPVPSQLKVKVTCDSGNYVTLVAAFTITYQSLIDRIDAKLARFTNSSIGRGSLKLRYRDEDGDYITIQSDDDIQIAFLEWREGARSMYSGGGMGEILLFCVGETV